MIYAALYVLVIKMSKLCLSVHILWRCVPSVFAFCHVDVTVMFSQSLYSVYENAGVVKPVLVLSNPSSVGITIQVSDVQDGATGE